MSDVLSVRMQNFLHRRESELRKIKKINWTKKISDVSSGQPRCLFAVGVCGLFQRKNKEKGVFCDTSIHQ